MLWVKTFHIVFVISWFAVIFYLPRLFVYHAQVRDEGEEATHKRFCIMERRLLIMGHLTGSLALFFGLWLLVLIPAYLSHIWLWLKLALVVVLIGQHVSAAVFVRQFAAGSCDKTHRWFRVYNEVPVLLLIVIVALVEFKPWI